MKTTKWLKYEFQSSSSKTEEFKQFSRDFKSDLKKLIKDEAFLRTFRVGHFYVSGFIERNNKLVYFSISDVRNWHDKWYDNVLVRTAKHTKDWTGGANNFCELKNIAELVLRLT